MLSTARRVAALVDQGMDCKGLPHLPGTVLLFLLCRPGPCVKQKGYPHPPRMHNLRLFSRCTGLPEEVTRCLYQDLGTSADPLRASMFPLWVSSGSDPLDEGGYDSLHYYYYYLILNRVLLHVSRDAVDGSLRVTDTGTVFASAVISADLVPFGEGSLAHDGAVSNLEGPLDDDNDARHHHGDRYPGGRVASSSSTAVVVCSDGQIFTVGLPLLHTHGHRINGPPSPQVTLQGAMASGCILASSWNPNRSCLVIVEPSPTESTPTISLFDSTLCPIVENVGVVVSPEVVSKLGHKPVNVGWGRKETQFHGQGNRDKALEKKEIDEGIPDGDDGGVGVVWKEDGRFFAVNVAVKATRGSKDGPQGVVAADEGAPPLQVQRKVFVYEGTGQLYSISEPFEGLLNGTIAWNKDLIAVCQQTGGSLHASPRWWCSFVERNGLRHGEFEIPSAASKFQWLDPSTMLIRFRDASAALYTVGNYHWYLKQFWPGQVCDCAVLSGREHSDDLQLVTLTRSPKEGGENQTQAPPGFSLTHSFVRKQVTQAASVVAVIDGPKLLVTPFQHSSIPPPMAHFEIEFQGAINEVTELKGVQGNEYQIEVVLANGARERLCVDVFDGFVKHRESVEDCKAGVEAGKDTTITIQVP